MGRFALARAVTVVSQKHTDARRMLYTAGTNPTSRPHHHPHTPTYTHNPGGTKDTDTKK
jgi:hypothetical protein